MNDTINRNRWLAIVAVAALGVGLVGGPVLASVTAPRAYSPIVAAPGDTTPEHTISVGGSGKITVIPAEPVVSRLHVNLRTPARLEAKFASGNCQAKLPAGLTWVGPGGIPEELRP